MTATDIKQATAPGGTPGGLDAWRGFKGLIWRDSVSVRDFIKENYSPYQGDASFLAGPTKRTTQVWHRLGELFPKEREKGVLDVSLIPSSITAHDPGYIDKDRELIVGLQTDAPLKRAIMPNGGLRMVETALTAYGYPVPREVHEIFTKYRKSHNDGRLRRLHLRRPVRPQVPHRHRPAGRVRPRPHHRRLPSRRLCTAWTG